MVSEGATKWVGAVIRVGMKLGVASGTTPAAVMAPDQSDQSVFYSFFI